MGSAWWVPKLPVRKPWDAVQQDILKLEVIVDDSFLMEGLQTRTLATENETRLAVCNSLKYEVAAVRLQEIVWLAYMKVTQANHDRPANAQLMQK